MSSPDLSGLSTTYRQPASGRSFIIPVLAISAGAGLLGLSFHAATEVQVIAWVAYACLAVAVGLGARRLQPATRLTSQGVRWRRFASGWHLIDWGEVVAVESPPDLSGDPVLHLRSGEQVRLYGMVPATADALAVRLVDRHRLKE